MRKFLTKKRAALFLILLCSVFAFSMSACAKTRTKKTKTVYYSACLTNASGARSLWSMKFPAAYKVRVKGNTLYLTGRFRKAGSLRKVNRTSQLTKRKTLRLKLTRKTQIWGYGGEGLPYHYNRGEALSMMRSRNGLNYIFTVKNGKVTKIGAYS